MTKLIIGLVVGLAIGGLAAFFVIRKATVKKIGNFIDGLVLSKETIRQFFLRYLSEKELDNYVRDLKEKLSSMLYARISDPSVCDDVSRIVVERLADNLSTSDEDKAPSRHGLLGNARRAVRHVLRSHAEEALVENQDVIEQMLSGKISEVVLNNGKEIISSIIDNEIDKILSQPVSTLMEGNEEMITTIKQKFVG